jgi:hypothetical protein
VHEKGFVTGDGDRIDLAANDTERRDKAMIPMIIALVTSRGADRV